MHTFPHRTFAICKVPTVNPSGKNQRFLPAPFGKGAFGCGIGGFPPNLLHIPSSLFPKKARCRYCGGNWGVDTLYQVPTQKQTVSLAPAGSLRHLRCQLPPVGSYGVHTFPHRTFAICKVPTVNPSGKNQRFLPAPFNKGAFGCGIDTGRVREVTSSRNLSCEIVSGHCPPKLPPGAPRRLFQIYSFP